MSLPQLNSDFLNQVVLNNTLMSWLIFVVGTVVLYSFFRFMRWFLDERLLSDDRVKNITAAKAADLMVKSTRSSFLFLFAVYFSGWHLEIGARGRQLIDPLMVIILLVQLWKWGSLLIQFFVERVGSKSAGDDGAKKTTLAAVTGALRIFLLLTLAILGLDRVGINVTPLVAGLGVGGIAITLALQSILGDVFASISIVLDKPFVIGDDIATQDGLSGTVESIGIKTTRVRSTTGEQLVFPNANILQNRLKNYRRMGRRRVTFNIGVKYDTRVATLREIPVVIENIIKAQELTSEARVRLISLGDFAIIFEVAYWFNSRDFEPHSVTLEQILLEILSAFEEKKISLAFPTREILLNAPLRPVVV